MARAAGAPSSRLVAQSARNGDVAGEWPSRKTVSLPSPASGVWLVASDPACAAGDFLCEHCREDRDREFNQRRWDRAAAVIDEFAAKPDRVHTRAISIAASRLEMPARKLGMDALAVRHRLVVSALLTHLHGRGGHRLRSSRLDRAAILSARLRVALRSSISVFSPAFDVSVSPPPWRHPCPRGERISRSRSLSTRFAARSPSRSTGTSSGSTRRS